MPVPKGTKVRTIHPKGRPDVYMHIEKKPGSKKWVAGKPKHKKEKE